MPNLTNIIAGFQLWLARRNKRYHDYLLAKFQREMKEAVDYFVEHVDLDVKDITFTEMNVLDQQARQLHRRNYGKWLSALKSKE